MSPVDTILTALAVPLIGAVLIAAAHRAPNVRETITLVTATALFLLVASLLPEVAAAGRPAVTLFEVMPGLALKFEVEPLGMLFALVASVLWIVTSVYSIGYMRGNEEENQTRYYVCFAGALASAIGIAFAGNLFTLFLFYEALTLITYPLVAHHGTAEAMHGGRVYLGVLLTTSIVFLLTVIIWTWSVAGTLDFVPGGILEGKVEGPVVGIMLALYMFGIGKAALMPFHRWLPAAMVAPAPVSALLHAVAVVKAGVFSVMKVAVYVFGVDLLSSETSTDWLAYVAAFTILAASIVALRQDNLKRRLAYSTVSQLSYVVLGAALANAAGVIGGTLQIAMHACAKITLFFCAGAIYTAIHKNDVSELDGMGKVMPFTFAAYTVAALSVIGLPPLGGAWSKFFLINGAVDAGTLLMVAVLIASSLLNVAYLLTPALRAFFLPAKDTHYAGKVHEAPLACVAPLCATAAGCVLLFFFAQPIFDFVALLV
ncbi:MAG: proton-conducting transporter membrane subunit [Betaproteobacteria bacterium]|nr:proton-conducting transporter membrane subunit [Betaproteobacteria bacterium]MDH3437481.1 proton-conducting transporter membrane subunit [Betaproteobacteria bacterium]